MNSKTITGAVAAALLTTALATPAEARHRYEHRRGNGISLGDVVLGTIAVAGVATAVGALSSGRRYEDGRYRSGRYEDGRYGDRGYEDGGYRGARNDESASVQACTYEAEREAGQRFGSAGRVDIQDVDAQRDGYSVRGTVLVQDSRGGDRYYDRARSGRVAFSCTAAYGEVTGLRLGSSYAGY